MIPVLFGGLVGLALGALGGGGSIVAVPALVYGAGVPLAEAVATSLVVVGASAAVGAIPHIRTGQVRWRVAFVFGAAGMGASVAGAALHHRLDERVVMAGLGAVMAVVGVRLWRPVAASPLACRVDEQRTWWRCLPQTAAAGAAVGLLTGLFGVGGGFLAVPAMITLLGLPMPAAIGTSLVVMTMNALAGVAAHGGTGALDVGLVARFGAGAITGGLAGGALGARADDAWLRRAFAAVVLVLAVVVLGNVALR